jgi:hypothetical protein
MLIYGFLPSVMRFREVIVRRRAERIEDPPDAEAHA